MIRTASRFVAVAAIGAAGCGSDDPPSFARNFVVRDSAGIAIVDVPGNVARRPNGWRVDAIPDLTIGARDASRPEQFHRIRGVRGLSDGHILVVDEGSAQIRFFDREGSFLYSLGDKGRGPGEFERIALVPSARTDSLFLHDWQLDRFTLLTGDGHTLETFPPAATRGRPVGGVGGILLNFHTVNYFSAREGVLENPASYRVYDVATEREDTVGDFPGERVYTTFKLGPISGMYALPFDVGPSAAPSRDGFYITAGDNAEILRYDIAASLTQIIRLIESARPVTGADIERHITSALAHVESAEALQAQTAVFREMPIPNTFPAFEALLVDDTGLLWAELYRAARTDGATWLVLDAAGRPLGAVDLPPELEVEYIGTDFILGLVRDEWGVEYVRRHALHRTPAAAGTGS